MSLKIGFICMGIMPGNVLNAGYKVMVCSCRIAKSGRRGSDLPIRTERGVERTQMFVVPPSGG